MYPDSSKCAQRPFALVHMDLIGPMPVKSWDWKRYILMFIDDFSGFALIACLHNKDDASQSFIKMVKWCEVQTASTLTSVHSDHGGEYMGLALQLFFRTHGVTHQTSAPYTPQQNGCTERFNCTLLEKANVMWHHACLPCIFWQDAVQTALHIYNHQSMCRLHWKTPNEMFLGDKPDISYFKIFGTCAYVHIPSDTREDKLSPWAEQMIFIGYPPNSKAYRFWSQDRQWVNESTTAIFDERMFSYCSKENQDRPRPPIPENIDPHINPSYDKSPSTRKLEPSGHVFIPQPLLPLPQLQKKSMKLMKLSPTKGHQDDESTWPHGKAIHHQKTPGNLNQTFDTPNNYSLNIKLPITSIPWTHAFCPQAWHPFPISQASRPPLEIQAYGSPTQIPTLNNLPLEHTRIHSCFCTKDSCPIHNWTQGAVSLCEYPPGGWDPATHYQSVIWQFCFSGPWALSLSTYPNRDNAFRTYHQCMQIYLLDSLEYVIPAFYLLLSLISTITLLHQSFFLMLYASVSMLITCFCHSQPLRCNHHWCPHTLRHRKAPLLWVRHYLTRLICLLLDTFHFQLHYIHTILVPNQALLLFNGDLSQHTLNALHLHSFHTYLEHLEPKLLLLVFLPIYQSLSSTDQEWYQTITTSVLDEPITEVALTLLPISPPWSPSSSSRSLAFHISSQPIPPTETLAPKSGFSWENTLLTASFVARSPQKRQIMAFPTQTLPQVYQPLPTTPSTQCFLCHNLGHYQENCPNYQCPHCHEMAPGHPSHLCMWTQCTFCQHWGHSDQVCPQRLCRDCDQPGHLSDDCPFMNLSPEQAAHIFGDRTPLWWVMTGVNWTHAWSSSVWEG